MPAFLEHFQASPNDWTFGHNTHVGVADDPWADNVAADSAEVAALLRKGASADELAAAAAAKGVSIQDTVGSLVNKATNLHALSKHLKGLTDDTPDEGLGKAVESFGRGVEAGTRAFAFRTGAKTLAVPPHGVVYVSGFGGSTGFASEGHHDGHHDDQITSFGHKGHKGHEPPAGPAQVSGPGSGGNTTPSQPQQAAAAAAPAVPGSEDPNSNVESRTPSAPDPTVTPSAQPSSNGPTGSGVSGSVNLIGGLGALGMAFGICNRIKNFL